MPDYITQLKELKDKAQNNKEEKIRLEQQLKSLEEQHLKLLEELKTLEVKPGEAEKMIKEFTEEIEDELTKINGLING